MRQIPDVATGLVKRAIPPGVIMQKGHIAGEDHIFEAFIFKLL